MAPCTSVFNHSKWAPPGCRSLSRRLASLECHPVTLSPRSPPQPSHSFPRAYEPGPRTQHGRRLRPASRSGHGTGRTGTRPVAVPSGRSLRLGPRTARSWLVGLAWHGSRDHGPRHAVHSTGGWLLKRAGHGRAGNSGPAHRLSVPPPGSPPLYPPGTTLVRRPFPPSASFSSSLLFL